MFGFSPRSYHRGPSAPSAEPGSSGLTFDCKTHLGKLGFQMGLCTLTCQPLTVESLWKQAAK